MAPFAAASMRATGEDPGAKAIVKRSGPNRWHAVVQRSDGTIRDPSRETGMGQTNGVLGGALPMMMVTGGASVVGGAFIARPQLAMRPIRDRSGQVEAWQARADLPWHWAPGTSPADVAMASLHASPVSSQSVVGACDGLVRLGEANDVPDEILDRARAISAACEGYDWHDIAEEYGEDNATAAGMLVSGFFGGLKKLAKKVAPMLSATPFAPLAATFGGKAVAQRMAPAGGGGGGGGMGHGNYSTQMPIMQMKEFIAQNPQFAPIAQKLLPMAGMAFGPLGAMGGSMLSQFVTPQQAQQAPQVQAFNHASPDLQQLLMQGGQLPPGGGGGGFDPMSMLSMFGGGALPFG
jgi:hypothetical protein